jgi:predicted amidohydrolase YtcJ
LIALLEPIMRISRRSFLASTSAFTLVPVLPQAARAATIAEKIYTGGPILTMNDAQPRVEAVAVTGGKIIAVGSLAEVSALKGPNTLMVDLGGRTLVPGFVDPHGHTTMGGVQAVSANLLSPPDGEVVDIASLQKTMRDWMAANTGVIEKAKLVIGFGYDQSQLAELRAPTKEELDAISIDLPIVLFHQSGHMVALNSKAFAMAGITAATEDPPGGVIQRVPGSREPSGVLEENAKDLALPALLGNVGPKSLTALAMAGAEMWASYGYTTAQEGKSTKAIDDVWRALAKAGKLPIDIVSYPDYLLGRDYIAGAASKDYDGRFRVGGAKLTIDGSPQGFTAWRDRPYFAPVGHYPPGYAGYPAVTTEKVVEALDWSFANKVQILVHSNGEAASDTLIAAVKAATEAHGRGDHRPVLVHGQFEREDQVQSFVDLNVFPSLFPMHTFYWGDWHREHTVGPALVDNISPTGWYRARGSMFSSHADAPVAYPDSMRILDATVTRRSRSGDIIGPAQRVDVITALKAMTIWPAYQHFEEASKGSLEVGKRADFAILSADPAAVAVDTLDQIVVTETVKDGKSIYVRGEKKTDLMRPKDIRNVALFESFRQLHLMRELAFLPEAERTEESRQAILASYDNCDATLLLPWLFGLPDAGRTTSAPGNTLPG